MIHQNRNQLDALTATSASADDDGKAEPVLATNTAPTPPTAVSDLIPSSTEATVAAASIRAARENANIRENAKVHERIVVVAVTTIVVFTMALYLGKVDCYFYEDATPELISICRNAMGIEGVVAAPALVTLSMIPMRSVAQIATLVVVLIFYFVSWIIGEAAFAETTVTYKVSAAVFVVSTTILTCVTGNRWDSEQRNDFEVLLGLIQRKESTERLAEYVQTVADSVLPSSLVNRISRGVKVRDVRHQAAVAVVSVMSIAAAERRAPSFGVLESSAEFVCALHCTKSMLDKCLEWLVDDSRHEHNKLIEIVKTHSVGDEYCLTAYPSSSNSASDAPLRTRFGLLVSAASVLKQFGEMIQRQLELVARMGYARSSNTHQPDIIADQVVCVLHKLQLFLAAAMDVGEVVIATVGTVHNVVAIGQPVEWARTQVASTLPPLASPVSSYSCPTSHIICVAGGEICPYLVLSHSTAFSRASGVVTPAAVEDTASSSSNSRGNFAGRASTNLQGSSTGNANPLLRPSVASSPVSYANHAVPPAAIAASKSTSATIVSMMDAPAGLSLSNHNNDYIGGSTARTNSRTKMSTVRTLAMRLNETKPASLVIRRRLFFQYAFESPDMESQFSKHVATADESQRTVLEFVNAFFIACCFIVASAIEQDPLRVGNSSLVWSILAAVVAGCAVPLISVVGKSASWPGRVLELIWLVLIGLAIWFAGYGSFIAHSEVLIAPVLFRLVVMREKKFLLVSSLLTTLIMGGFLIYITVHNFGSGRPVILTCGSLIIQSVAAVVALLLVERFQRVRFSITQELTVVDQALKEATLLLDDMLKKMFPSASIQRLISLRHLQSMKMIAAREGGDVETSFSRFLGDRLSDRRATGVAQNPLATPSSLKVALHGSYFATATRDMAVCALSLRPSCPPNADNVTSSTLCRLQAMDDECNFLSQFSAQYQHSVVLTKVCGDIAYVCLDTGDTQCQPTEEVFVLTTAITQYMKESRQRQLSDDHAHSNESDARRTVGESDDSTTDTRSQVLVEVAGAIAFGPLTGALLGTAVLSYEFLGPAILQCKAAASALPAWGCIMTESAVNMYRWHVRYSLAPTSHDERNNSVNPDESEPQPSWEAESMLKAPVICASAPHWFSGIGQQTFFTLS